MLSRLLKHEFIATWRVPVALDAVLIVLGIIAHFTIRSIPYMKDSIALSILLVSLIGIYYIGLIAANVITLVYLVMRYYRNLYSQEGYLTFTLPVTTQQIINAKVISGYLWELLDVICTFASLFIAGTGLVKAVDAGAAELQEFTGELISVFGLQSPRFIITAILTLLLSPLFAIMSIYVSVTVGQLWQKHKILGAVFCYIGIYILNQILAQISLFTSGFYNLMNMEYSEDFDATFGSIYSGMLTSSLLMQAVLAVIFYICCVLITKKKINLD